MHLRLLKDVAAHAALQTEAKKHIHRELRDRLPDCLLVVDDQLIAIEAKQTGPNRQATAILLRTFLEREISAVKGWKVKKTVREWASHEPKIGRVSLIDLNIADLRELRSSFDRIVHGLNEPVRVSVLSFDASTAWHQMADRLAQVIAAQFAVASDPDIRGGEPVVRGTRIPVYALQDLVEQGATREELLSDYPALDAQRLERALLYARIHPRAGRPKKRPWHAPAAQ